MSRIGYAIDFEVLNTKDWLPQNRERIYIIGIRLDLLHKRDSGLYVSKNRLHRENIKESKYQLDVFGDTRSERLGDYTSLVGTLGGGSGREIFPVRKDGGEYNEVERQQSQITGTINSCMSKGGNKQDANSGVLVGALRTHKDGEGFREVNSNLCPTIPVRAREDGSGQPVIQRHPLKFLDRNQKNIEGDYSFTVDSINTGGVKIDSRIRRLTPIECEKLQGFPYNWTAEGTGGAISDTQRYKMCGNAVSVPVVKAVGEAIANSFDFQDSPAKLTNEEVV